MLTKEHSKKSRFCTVYVNVHLSDKITNPLKLCPGSAALCRRPGAQGIFPG